MTETGNKKSQQRNLIYDLHILLTYLLIYLLSPCIRVLEKVTAPQLVKKFAAFYGTRRLITAFTSSRQQSLSPKDQSRPEANVSFHDEASFLAHPPSWNTTPCRPSATVYSIHSQLPSILEVVPPSAT